MIRKYSAYIVHGLPNGSRAGMTVTFRADCFMQASRIAVTKSLDMHNATVASVWLASQGDFKTRTNN